MPDLTHTRLPEPGTPPTLAADRLHALIAHALTHPQQAPAPRSATILAFRRHAWATGLAAAGLAAALMLAVLPGTFDSLTRHSTVTTGGLGQTAAADPHDDVADIDDMLTLNTLDSFGADDTPAITPATSSTGQETTGI